MNENPNPAYYDDDEIDLLDLLLVLARNKKLIFLLTTLFAVIAIAAALLMTPIYKATSRVLPPGVTGSGGGMSSMLKAAMPSLGGLGGPTPGEVVASLAKSRAVLDPLIKEFDLMNYYEQEGQDKTREALSNALSANADSKSGLISFSIEDKDPEFAATLSNAVVAQVQNVMQQLALSDVAQERLFLEDQVKQAQLQLINAENDLAAFQKESGVLDARSETSSLVGAMASFRARIAAKEVQLKSLRTFATSSNPQAQKLQAEISGLKEELSKLEAEKTLSRQPDDALGPVTAEELPDVGTEYVRKLRDLRFAETLYAMLLKQYEDARMREASNPTILQVIDPAVAPEQRTKPNRKLMVVLATVLGFFVSIFAAFIREFARNANADPDRAHKMTELKTALSLRRKKAQAPQN